MTTEENKMSRSDWKTVGMLVLAVVIIGYLTDHYTWAKKLGSLFDSVWALFLIIVIAFGLIIILVRIVSALLNRKRNTDHL